MSRQLGDPLQRLPGVLRRGAGRAASGLTQRIGKGVQYGDALFEAGHGRLSFWGGYVAFRGSLKERIVANGGGRDSYDIVARLWREAEEQMPSADLLQKMTYLELRQRLAELLLMRVDKMTMATSIEARVPFLDHDLVEFAVALPERMKVRDGEGKYILKRAVEGLLPHEIVYRRKQGFGAPVSEWFQGDFGVRAQEQMRRSSLAERGLIDYDAVDDLWRRHRAGRGDWAAQLWTLYNVSVWHDYWVAGRSVA
jgi:asparagine synthase (glutamine-hydrolysing)